MLPLDAKEDVIGKTRYLAKEIVLPLLLRNAIQVFVVVAGHCKNY